MLRPRIIPFLLLHKSGLVKTIRFSAPKYVGDPLNAIRIFNEKEVDEIIVADIDATVLGKEPDYNLISLLASECRMPLCYIGGVKSVRHVERIISLGVEKVGISSAAIIDLRLIEDAAHRVGNQSVVVVLDVHFNPISKLYTLRTHNGVREAGVDLVSFALQAQSNGVGEIVVNSIDRDGMSIGYDFNLIDKIKKSVSVPITALGGAGTLEDIKNLFDAFGIIGAAAGSLFVFKGKHRAVLIQYPDRNTKASLYGW